MPLLIGRIVGYAVVAAGLSGCAVHPTTESGSFAPGVQSNPPRQSSSVESGPSTSREAPHQQAFRTYIAPDHSFLVKVPQGWTQATTDGGVAFSDPLDSLVIAQRSGFYYPSVDYAFMVEIPEIAVSTTGFATRAVGIISRPAGQVVSITYQADQLTSLAAALPVHQMVQRYEFTHLHTGRQVLLTLAQPASVDDTSTSTVITDSFTWLT